MFDRRFGGNFRETAKADQNTTEQRTGSDVSEGFNFHNRPNPSSTGGSENVGDTQKTVYLDWTAHASRPTFPTFTRFLPTTIAGEGYRNLDGRSGHRGT